jgi:hypothetical protein
LVVLVTTVMTGCSVTQVTAWFAYYRHQTISADQARSIANTVNPHVAPACDSNYAGGCVPNNIATAHCLGLPGDGYAVKGPLQVSGWDHLGLDTDGDKVACPSGAPIGSLDLIQQSAYGISLAGWALDPDTSAPLRIDIYEGGNAHSVIADQPRPDLGAVAPGAGTAHGFSDHFDAVPGTHNICVFAINGAGAGDNTLLACKSVAVERVNPFDQLDTGDETIGLLETSDTGPDGSLRMSGFVYDPKTGTLPSSIRLYAFFTSGSITIPLSGANLNIARPDVQVYDSTAPLVSGFDITIPHSPADSFGFVVLQQVTAANPDGFPVSSRLVNETTASPQLPLSAPLPGFTDPFNYQRT